MATVIRGNGSAAVTKPASGLDIPASQVVAIGDGEGNVMSFAGGALPVAGGSGPFTSLNAVTVTGAGASLDLGVIRSAHSMQTTTTGSPTGVTVLLEGSLDNAHFVTLATSTSTSGDVQTATGKAVRYVRANLTVLSGGTSPTVTAIVASAQ